MRSDLLEAIAQMHGGSVVSQIEEDGKTRVKVVLSKQQLKRLMLLMGSNGRRNQPAMPLLPSPSSTLEQRLWVMKRRHQRKVESSKGSHGSWRPALQSIPEEL